MAKKEKTLTVTRCFESNESKQIEPRGASLIRHLDLLYRYRRSRSSQIYLDLDLLEPSAVHPAGLDLVVGQMPRGSIVWVVLNEASFNM